MPGIGVSNLAVQANELVEVQRNHKRKISPLIYGVAPALTIPMSVMASSKFVSPRNIDAMDKVVEHEKNHFTHGLMAGGVIGGAAGWLKLTEKHPEIVKKITNNLSKVGAFVKKSVEKFVKPETFKNIGAKLKNVVNSIKTKTIEIVDGLTKLVNRAPKPVKVICGILLALIGLHEVYNAGKIDQKHTPKKPLIMY